MERVALQYAAHHGRAGRPVRAGGRLLCPRGAGTRLRTGGRLGPPLGLRRDRRLARTAQLLLPLQDAALDGLPGLDLLAQGLFPLVALLVGTLAVASDAFQLAGEALALADLRREQGCEAAERRCGARERLEQLARARVGATPRRD